MRDGGLELRDRGVELLLVAQDLALEQVGGDAEQAVRRMVAELGLRRLGALADTREIDPGHVRLAGAQVVRSPARNPRGRRGSDGVGRAFTSSTSSKRPKRISVRTWYIVSLMRLLVAAGLRAIAPWPSIEAA